jgi:hypothetical protein
MAAAVHAALEGETRVRDPSKQRLRLRRFLFASTFSLLYLMVLGLFLTQGRIDSTTLVQVTTVVGILIFAFSLLFLSGLNLRVADPSLTAWQFLAAVFTMLFVVYRGSATAAGTSRCSPQSRSLRSRS